MFNSKAFCIFVETVGVDVSEEAAIRCREILRVAKVSCEVLVGSFELVFSSSPRRFDFIAWDSPFINTQEGMRAGFVNAFDLLKPGGMMWVKFRHPDSWFHGMGRPLCEGTYMLDERAGPYSGALYSFHTRDQGSELLASAGFSISNVERIELWKNNESERHVWTVFWAAKSR